MILYSTVLDYIKAALLQSFGDVRQHSKLLTQHLHIITMMLMYHKMFYVSKLLPVYTNLSSIFTLLLALVWPPQTPERNNWLFSC